VTLSKTEAECMALCEVTRKLIWFTRSLKEISLFEFISRPQITFVDNRSAIDLMQNAVSSERNKHFDAKRKFVHEKIKAGDTGNVSYELNLLLTFK